MRLHVHIGMPPRPPLTEMEDRRATVTDALQSTTFRLYSSAAPACDSDRRVTVNNIQVILVCGRPGDRGGGTETPAASVPGSVSNKPWAGSCMCGNFPSEYRQRSEFLLDCRWYARCLYDTPWHVCVGGRSF